MKKFRLFVVILSVFLVWSIGSDVESIEASNPLRLQWPVVMPYASGSFDGVNGPHTGVDIITTSNPEDYTIVAAAEGRVSAVKFDSISGNVIKIEHTGFDGGAYYTWYGHLSSMDVVENQSVTRGQKIGVMGCTGKCEGTHLHFQVMLNSSVMTGLPCLACINPCDYLVGVVSGTYGKCGIDGTIPTPGPTLVPVATVTPIPVPTPTATATATAQPHMIMIRQRVVSLPHRKLQTTHYWLKQR